jgi:hypothetical protein
MAFAGSISSGKAGTTASCKRGRGHEKLQGFSLCLAPGKQIDNFFVLTVQRPHGSVILPDTAKSLPAVLLRPSKSWESFRLGKDKTNLKAVSMSPRHVA